MYMISKQFKSCQILIFFTLTSMTTFTISKWSSCCVLFLSKWYGSNLGKKRRMKQLTLSRILFLSLSFYLEIKLAMLFGLKDFYLIIIMKGFILDNFLWWSNLAIEERHVLSHKIYHYPLNYLCWWFICKKKITWFIRLLT